VGFGRWVQEFELGGLLADLFGHWEIVGQLVCCVVCFWRCVTLIAVIHRTGLVVYFGVSWEEGCLLFYTHIFSHLTGSLPYRPSPWTQKATLIIVDF
jgi:hypothetical protein